VPQRVGFRSRPASIDGSRSLAGKRLGHHRLRRVGPYHREGATTTDGRRRQMAWAGGGGYRQSTPAKIGANILGPEQGTHTLIVELDATIGHGYRMRTAATVTDVTAEYVMSMSPVAVFTKSDRNGPMAVVAPAATVVAMSGIALP